MKNVLLIAAIATVCMLTGCATPGPEARPYSQQERAQLSMEALNRQALPFDQYMQARARLMRAQTTTASDLAEDAGTPSQAGRDS
jgi:hypothetical protein